MSIPIAATAQVPQLIYALGSQITWANSLAVVNGLEAGFYACLRGGTQHAAKVVNWIRETSIAHINDIQILFHVVNGGIILFTAKKLLEEVQAKFSATVVDKNAAPYAFASIPVALAVGTTVSLAVFLIHRWISPSVKPKEAVQQVDISETSSLQQKITQVLQIAKLVINVGLILLAKNKFWLAISIAAEGYSLFKNREIRWLTFSRTFPYVSYNPQVPITQLETTYKVLALPFDKTATHDACAICHDADEEVGMTFCANHLFHKECVADLVVSKSDSFINNPKIIKTATDHYENGIYMYTSHSYEITVSQDNFPACPICQDIPLHNACEIEVTDQIDGQFDAHVIIDRPPTDRQYLFENLYAVYSVAQAALAYLQTYSELAGAIFKIQKALLVFDVIGYVFTAYYLYQNINEKFNPQDSTRIKLAIGAALVATAVLSYFALVQINAYLQSAIIINDLLAKLDISPEILNTIAIGWKGPLSHKLMQTLYVNRIATTVALSYFSNQWKTNLLSAAAQLASLAGISNLKWIEITQTLDWPFEKIIANGGTLFGYLHEKSAESLSFTAHFLVDRSCAADAGHLMSTLQSISNFTINFFNKSSWDHFWWVTYTNGIETGRKLYYSVSLQNNPLERCGCSLIPTLTDYAIKAVHAGYGSVGITIL